MMRQQKTAVTVPAEKIEKRRSREKCPQCGHLMSLHLIFPAFGTLYIHLKCLYCGSRAIISVDENKDLPSPSSSSRVSNEDLDFYSKSKSSIRRPVEEAVLHRENRIPFVNRKGTWVKKK